MMNTMMMSMGNIDATSDMEDKEQRYLESVFHLTLLAMKRYRRQTLLDAG